MVAPRPPARQAARRTVWTAEASGADDDDSRTERKYAGNEDQKSADSSDIASSPVARSTALQPHKRPRTHLTRRPRTSVSAATKAAQSAAPPLSATSWFALSSQLVIQAHKLEREAAVANRAASWLWEGGGRLEAEVVDGNRQLLQWSRTEEGRQQERQKEALHLYRSIKRIRTALGPFLHHVSRQQRRAAQQVRVVGEDWEGERQDGMARELEEEMECIEDLLTRFKQEQKRLYLALDREEKEAEADCSVQLQRIQQWEAADADAATTVA